MENMHFSQTYILKQIANNNDLIFLVFQPKFATVDAPLSIINNGTKISIDLANYATLTNLSTGLANLVNSAPSTLDTLKEIAIALGNDSNFSTIIATLIGTKQELRQIYDWDYLN